ncbi:hypothetical protein AAFF_G00175250 [Aldrovandia affinis]|uniref:Uncharacterized protein n=1 Tax=Aldrovandia affinis TaxID=143900 RepID=A0AAD7VWR8_9TELE|nr:hypothetical protein AAFF_G00175250 [Aldrovandia affinis]
MLSVAPPMVESELKVQWQAFSNEAEKLLAANSNYEEGLLAEAEEDSTKLSEQQAGDIEAVACGILPWRKDWESFYRDKKHPSGSRKKFQLLESVEETIVKDLRLASHNTAKDVFRVLENRFGNKNAITILIVAELQKISPVKEHQFRKVIDLIQSQKKL